jgi:hypothetical protein
VEIMMDSFLYIETAQRIQSKQPPSPVEAIKSGEWEGKRKRRKKGSLEVLSGRENSTGTEEP